MDLLKITSLRPGRNGSNRADPNCANYDESKANPYASESGIATRHPSVSLSQLNSTSAYQPSAKIR
ncbi:MAG: hypothetical protein NTW28_14880 [Candidatus Solibacter sp.]|nr:hypothetical protein [Candidatus Solibacter sp.]